MRNVARLLTVQLCTFAISIVLCAAPSANTWVTQQFELVKPGVAISEVRVYDLPLDPIAGNEDFCSGSSPAPPADLLSFSPTSSFLCDQGYWQYWGASDPGFQNEVGPVMGNGTDAVGALYVVRRSEDWAQGSFCNGGLPPVKTFEIVRQLDTGDDEIVARVKMCVTPFVGADRSYTRIMNINVDPVNGFVNLSVEAKVTTSDPNITRQRARAVVRISGLPTLLDVMASYTPVGTLAWNTPKLPEALPGLDRFLVFKGNVAELKADQNFSRAVPGAPCSITNPDSPGQPPEPGQRLEINDPLELPARGQAKYAVIGVDKSGTRRFGRQYVSGVLSGRDPAAFIGCP